MLTLYTGERKKENRNPAFKELLIHLKKMEEKQRPLWTHELQDAPGKTTVCQKATWWLCVEQNQYLGQILWLKWQNYDRTMTKPLCNQMLYPQLNHYVLWNPLLWERAWADTGKTRKKDTWVIFNMWYWGFEDTLEHMPCTWKAPRSIPGPL